MSQLVTLESVFNRGYPTCRAVLPELPSPSSFHVQVRGHSGIASSRGVRLRLLARSEARTDESSLSLQADESMPQPPGRRVDAFRPTSRCLSLQTPARGARLCAGDGGRANLCLVVREEHLERNTSISRDKHLQPGNRRCESVITISFLIRS